MLIGYARTSTREQAAGLAAQRRDLAAAGCEQIIVEQTSSVGARPQLDALLTLAHPGDAIVVTKLDRFARSVLDLWALLRRVEAKGASLRILAFDGGSLDTATAQGKLMLNVLGAVAQFEREIMLERQREGIAKAKEEGKYKGRAPTARAQAAAVLALKAQGLGPAEIVRRLNAGMWPAGIAQPKGGGRISERSVYRILKAARHERGDEASGAARGLPQPAG